MTEIERFQKLAEELENIKSGQRPCPSCGRCPTCGRGAFWGTQPYPGYIPPPVTFISGTEINYPSRN